MYGLKISQSSGLRIIDIEKPIFSFRYSGYSNFRAYINNDEIMECPRTRISVDIANKILPTAVAFESGCIYVDTLTWDTGEIASFLEIRHEQGSPQKFYLFSEMSHVNDIPNDKYGIQVKDKNGVVIFHSGLKAMRILGHISKFKGLQWYSNDRHIGKKYAFIQIGNDLGYEWEGGNVGNILYKATRIKQSGNDVVLDLYKVVRTLKNQSIYGWSGWVDFNLYYTEVVWVIIDVTDL